MTIVLPHVFKDSVGEVASGEQVMEDLNKLKEEIERMAVVAASNDLRMQMGVFTIPGFGGGAFSFNVPIISAWPGAHLVFLAGNATSPTENKTWDVGGEVLDASHGKIKGGSGPNFEAAKVPWVSVGH